MRTHSEAVKKAVITKLLAGESTQKLISEEYGVGYSTVGKWLKSYRDSGIVVMSEKERRPQDWSIKERLSALMETASMDEKHKARWCRENGLHSHHLVSWRKQFESDQAPNAAQHRQLNKQQRYEIRGLEKELRRKDKALA